MGEIINFLKKVNHLNRDNKELGVMKGMKI